MATESNLAVQLYDVHIVQTQYHLQQWQDLFDTENIPHSCLLSDPMEPLTRHKEPPAETLCIGCEEQQGCPEPVLMGNCGHSITLELTSPYLCAQPAEQQEEALNVKGSSEGHTPARTLSPVRSVAFRH